jgi:hypothetical protein
LLKYDPVERVLSLLQGHTNLPALPTTFDKKAHLPWSTTCVFLGDAQSYGYHTESGKLNTQQVRDLKTLEIDAQVGTHYHRGLVTTATRTGEALDIKEIYKHLTHQIAEVRLFPDGPLAADAQRLRRGINLCARGLLWYARRTPGSAPLRRLRKEQELQYAQLGTLILPINFISQLQEPVRFVDTTAVRLGSLVELSLT